jgi:cobalt-zinc-cadmium efflux system protein
LLLAWGATRLALKAPSARFTYGLGSSTILAALTNAVLLLVATGAIVWEAVQRLYGVDHAEPVAASIVIAVALAGVVVNGATAMLFMRGREQDLNLKGAYLHMAADAAVSLGVAIAGGLILVTNWMWLDPLIGIVIALVIVWSTWFLLRESVRLALQAVPRGINVEAVKSYLESLQGVNEVHDLHIWAISTTQSALTVHLVMRQGHPGDEFFATLADELESRFRIGHPTVQIETGSAAVPCRLAPSNVL